MRYVSYSELADVPNIIVDGSATPATQVVLSHWPQSGSPPELAADLSAEIAFNYLDRPDLHVAVEPVSNNHFDLDGLVSVFALTQPEEAQRRRELLIDVASAGDFARCRSRDAARIAAALGSLSTDVTPATGDYDEQIAVVYPEMLDRLLDVVDHVDRYREQWAEDDDRITRTEQALADGSITIEDVPELDLAVVTVDERVGQQQFTGGASSDGWHPIAIHNATPRVRLMVLSGSRFELRDRYEGWVQLVSRRVQPRTDLRLLADRLNDEEPGGARWEADPPGAIVPALRLGAGDESGLGAGRFRAIVEAHLREAPPAWDPYGGA